MERGKKQLMLCALSTWDALQQEEEAYLFKRRRAQRHVAMWLLQVIIKQI